MLKSEFVPAADPKSPFLMVVLHGLGDSAMGYEWMPSELALPSLNYLLLNAPDSYYGGFSWYDIYGEASPGIERSRKLLFEVLDAQRERGFAPAQTVMFGFSQGCLMTIDVGARYPHRLGGLIGVSGYVHEPERLLKEFSPVAREQRFLVTHGTDDPLIPIGPVREQVAHLRAARLNIQWKEFNKAHTIAGQAELGVIRTFVQEAIKTGH